MQRVGTPKRGKRSLLQVSGFSNDFLVIRVLLTDRASNGAWAKAKVVMIDKAWAKAKQVV